MSELLPQEKQQDLIIKTLTQPECDAVAKVREQIIDKLRNTPETGVEVEYLGKRFFVPRGVFQPRPDSMPLVENFVVMPGEDVLDICTGAGTIAVFAAEKGAGRVVAVDINPDAVDAVRVNAKRFGVDQIIDARVSDVFSAIGADEVFSVITGNLPFTDEPSEGDMASKTLRDPGLRVAREFFAHLNEHLKSGGRVYVSQANSGNVEDMLKLAEDAGFGAQMIGKKEMGQNSLEFYAFELHKI